MGTRRPRTCGAAGKRGRRTVRQEGASGIEPIRRCAKMPLPRAPDPVDARASFGLDGNTMKSWMCVICGFIYSEEDGLPEEGIAPGTRWEDVPPNWVCPDCGARKEDFEMVEV